MQRVLALCAAHAQHMHKQRTRYSSAMAGLELTGPAPSAAIAAATAASFDLPLPDSRLIRCSSAWSSRPALTRAVRRGELEAAAAVAVVAAVAGALTAAAAAPAFCSSRANDRASVTPEPVQNSSGASASRNRTVSRVVLLKTVSWTSAARADTTEESCHLLGTAGGGARLWLPDDFGRSNGQGTIAACKASRKGPWWRRWRWRRWRGRRLCRRRRWRWRGRRGRRRCWRRRPVVSERLVLVLPAVLRMTDQQPAPDGTPLKPHTDGHLLLPVE